MLHGHSRNNFNFDMLYVDVCMFCFCANFTGRINKYYMKNKILIAALIALVVLSCKTETKKQVTEQKNSSVVVAVANPNAPVHLTKQMFLDEIMDYEKNPNAWIYKGKMPAVVDFYADWCKPCKITSPILDELAQEYAGKVLFYKINIDEEKELATVFGVQSIPTFLFIPQQGNPQMSAGIAQTPEETKAMFKQQIDGILIK
jgi:thioredoxin 1